MLPIPHHPNIIGVDVCLTYEVVGGMDGGGVRRKSLTCRNGLAKRRLRLMFCMRGWILTIGYTIEQWIILQIGSNNGNNNRVNNRSRTVITGWEKQRKTTS